MQAAKFEMTTVAFCIALTKYVKVLLIQVKWIEKLVIMRLINSVRAMWHWVLFWNIPITVNWILKFTVCVKFHT